MIADCDLSATLEVKLSISNWKDSKEEKRSAYNYLRRVVTAISQSSIRNSKYLWALPLLSCSLLAQPIDWARVHTLTIQGIDRLYDLKIDEAESTFDEVIRIAPDDPRGWFFKSMVHFYVYQLTRDEAAYKKFFDVSETVIDKAESLVDQNPNDLNAKFYLGGIYGYRGLAYQRNGSVIAGVWDGRKGYGLLKEAATGPNLSVDAKLGFGLFSYLIAKIPRSFSWILNIIGFSGDLEGGLAMIKAAADGGIYTRTEASFYYAQFCFFEDRYDEAEQYLRMVIDRYPANSLFLVTHATWKLRRDEIDSAIAIGERAIAVNERSQVRIGDEFAHSTLASAYFINGDFRQAAGHWEEFIDRSENKDNVGNFVYFRLGICYELQADRSRAIATWNRMARITDTDKPWESVYWRRAQLLIASPMNAVDIALLMAGNESQRGRRQHAIAMYQSAAHLAGTDIERKAQALYGIAQTAYQCDDDKAAMAAVPEILRMRPKRETWVIPHALLVLGRAQARQGLTADAKRTFEQALAYEDYDWEMNVRGRVERELEKMERPEK